MKPVPRGLAHHTRWLAIPTWFSAPLYRLDFRSAGRWFFYSALTGLVAGLGAIAFSFLSQGGVALFLESIAGFKPGAPAGEARLFSVELGAFRPYLLIVLPAVGGLLTGLLVYRFAREAAGHGTDAAIEAFHRGRGLIRGRVPFVKAIASAITIGSGGSGGREGPIAQIGAGFGSFLATRLKMSDRERRVLLAAGVGAGVGSIFRAPLAGALFAAEVLYSDPDFEPDVIVPAAISTVVAYCVYSIPFGFGALFATPGFRFHSALELIPYTVLAIVVAGAAGLFVEVFYGIHGVFERLSIRLWLRPAIGGLVTGLLAFSGYLLLRDRVILDSLSFGYGSLQEAILGNVTTSALLALAVAKMLTTSFTIGSGGSGGVFGPSMVIGGALGGVVGMTASKIAPSLAPQPGAFVVVGMAGFFAAAANTPISTLVMVSEMTGNYRLLLPSLWVCVLAMVLGRHWKLYRSQVPTRADSPAYQGLFAGDILAGIRVGDLVKDRPYQTVAESTTLEEIIGGLGDSQQQSYPVVDDAGALRGVISVAEIHALLDERGVGPLVIARDVAGPAPTTLGMDEDLSTALQRLVMSEVEELPVLESGESRRVVGLLTRRDVLAAYNQRHAARPPSAPLL